MPRARDGRDHTRVRTRGSVKVVGARQRRAVRLGIATTPEAHRLGHYGDATPHIPRLPATIVRLAVPTDLVPSGGCVFNPSVAVTSGGLQVMIRAYDSACHQAANIIGRIDEQWQLRGARHGAGIEHFEDLRLFETRHGQLMAIGYRSDFWHDEPAMVVVELSAMGDARAVHVQSAHGRAEKNWLPVVGTDDVRFVYSVDPLVTTRWDPATGMCDRVQRCTGIARGSSQLVPFEDGYLAVVHEVTFTRAGRVYSHRFVRFDAALTGARLGPPWCFEHAGIEFCAGMAHWNGVFVLSAGIRDREAVLAVVSADALRALLPEVGA